MKDIGETVLGLAVFGTMRGLFASGNGILAGLENSAEVLEFRDAEPYRDLVPRTGEIILFRRAISIFQGESLDLIGVAQAAEDLERRRGFFGLCAAVEHGNASGYQEAFEAVADLYQKVTSHYLVNGRLCDVPHDLICPDLDDYRRALTYVSQNNISPPFFLTAKWQDTMQRKLLFDVIGAVVRLRGEAASTIAVDEHSRSGAAKVSEDLLREYDEEIQRCGIGENKREEVSQRDFIPIDIERSISSGDRIQHLEKRVEYLESVLVHLPNNDVVLSEGGLRKLPPERDISGEMDTSEKVWENVGNTSLLVIAVLLIGFLGIYWLFLR